MDYIRQTDSNANIIHINFNITAFETLTEYHALEAYVLKHYVETTTNYLFIDEVQTCLGFEKAINSIHASEKFDIYITGSNAFLLSSDLATLFTGRTFEIKVYPFSFKEYLLYHDEADIQKGLDSYVKDGGMAGSYLFRDESNKYSYIADIFNTLIIRDISQKYRIRNKTMLEKLCDFLMDNISNITSSRNIAVTLSKSTDNTNDRQSGHISVTFGMLLPFIESESTTYEARSIWLLKTNTIFLTTLSDLLDWVLKILIMAVSMRIL